MFVVESGGDMLVFNDASDLDGAGLMTTFGQGL